MSTYEGNIHTYNPFKKEMRAVFSTGSLYNNTQGFPGPVTDRFAGAAIPSLAAEGPAAEVRSNNNTKPYIYNRNLHKYFLSLQHFSFQELILTPPSPYTTYQRNQSPLCPSCLRKLH
jgi:hypothetical protein